MPNKRTIRWPSLLGEVVNTIIVSVLSVAVTYLWSSYSETSERVLIVIAAMLALGVVVIVHERFRSERVIASTTVPAYEHILTKLAMNHHGTIDWITKTSIWADPPEAFSGRLTAKTSGLSTGRISKMRYVIHLGYWRNIAFSSLKGVDSSLLALYRTKLQTLLRHISDFRKCPPDKVQIVVGETEQPGPPYRFGIYDGKRGKELMFGYELPLGEGVIPRILMRGYDDIIGQFEGIFQSQWEKYSRRMMARSDFRVDDDHDQALRNSLIGIVNEELRWVDSHTVHMDSFPEYSTRLQSALDSLSKGRSVTLSCPQKVCISGDYGDMRDGGFTLTASINVRPRITIRQKTRKPSTLVIHPPFGTMATESGETWPLVDAFKQRLEQMDVAFQVDLHPSAFTRIGLGSSGAASLLLATASALATKQLKSLIGLVEDAHRFETEVASWPCGRQDHVASAFGGFRLIEYPSLAQKPVSNLNLWSSLGFWASDERRSARVVIPQILDSHTRLMWDLKRVITKNVTEAFESSSVEDLIEAIQSEFALQKQLRMPTDLQTQAADIISSYGGAAKVSGAGGGGMLVVVSPSRDKDERIRHALSSKGFREIQLTVDSQGLLIES